MWIIQLISFICCVFTCVLAGLSHNWFALFGYLTAAIYALGITIKCYYDRE